MEKLVYLTEEEFLKIINGWWDDAQFISYQKARYFNEFKNNIETILNKRGLPLFYHAQDDKWIIK